MASRPRPTAPEFFLVSLLKCVRQLCSRSASVPLDTKTKPAEADPLPKWFTQFLNRQTRKPSAPTMKAYRRDFIAIATLVIDDEPARLARPK
jgi:hypothetical protein